MTDASVLAAAPARPDLHVPVSWWVLFGAGVIVLLAVDLLAHRGEHGLTKKAALAWSAIWIGVALAFNAAVWLYLGSGLAEEFFAAYVLEKSLSLDNMFVFLVVFEQLRIPPSEQRRVLSWGILGALVMRGAFIALGAALLERWHFVVYGLGALLVYTGVQVLRRQKETSPTDNRALVWLRGKLPLTDGLRGHHFLVREGGRRMVTPLFLALVVIEFTDVVFAVDSVPAAFAVSDHPFIVYSSNVLALLGLRSLYLLLSSGMTKTRELEYALSAVLVFAGAKMLLSDVVHIPSLISVAVIVGLIGGALVVRFARRAWGRRRGRTRRTSIPSPGCS
jgi:tellurite resistance protein TerC